MTFFSQYLAYLRINWQTLRQFTWLFAMINIAFAVGLVIGFGYLIPEISETTALYLVSGTAVQMVVTVGLVGLPQTLSQEKNDGLVDYFWTLPASREAYLLAKVTFVLVQALPAIAFALVIGAWRYGFSLDVSPWVVLAIPLAVLSLGGLGIAMAILSPHMQLTNAVTQLIIFYVLFFAPVIAPASQLPAFLQHVGHFLPPTYAADAFRATLTDLPGTHLYRSMLVLAGFGVASLTAASLAVRRRG